MTVIWPRAIILLLAGLLLSAFPASLCRAETPQHAAQELRQRLDATLDEQQALLQGLANLGQELARLEREIQESQARLAELNAQEGEIQQQLPALQAQHQGLVGELVQARRRYGQGLKALYLQGPALNRALLSTATDFNDALVRSQSLAWLAQDLRRRLLALQAQTVRLEALEGQLAQRRQEITHLKQNIKERAIELESLRNSRKEVVADLEGRNQALALNLQNLREAQERLARTFALSPVAPGSTPGLSGAPTDAWSARGRSTSPVRGQVLGQASAERPGLIIQAPAQAPVRAPWAGVVVHAAPLAGYGLVLVLDHGSRVHTVLAHLGRLEANPGQRVEAGQVVGQVDASGRLYLEVRKAGRPENPMDWLRLDP